MCFKKKKIVMLNVLNSRKNPGSVNFEQKIGENLANTLANFFRAKGADWLPFSRKAPNFSKPSANGESAEEFLELWT